MNKIKLKRSDWSKSLTLIATILFFISCEESSINPTSTLSVPETHAEQIEYLTSHLTILGKSALQAAKKESFKQELYAEVEKQFDGDYNVLFETLKAKLSNDKGLFGARLSGISNEDLEQSLNAFKGIDGDDFFPQIYIPHFEELKEQNIKTNSRVLTENSDPIIVINIGDGGPIKVPGYRLNEYDDLEDVGFLVDEEYAINNEVWVISLNERYFGEVEDAAWPAEDPTNARVMASPSAAVEWFQLKCRNEDWLNGAVEVNIISLISDWGFYNAEFNTYGNNQYEGGRIRTIKRKDWDKPQDVYYYILNDWNDRAPNMPYGNIVIFEYDAWPASKNVQWNHGGDIFDWTYRSSNSYYDVVTMYKSDYCCNPRNNSCISWYSSYF